MAPEVRVITIGDGIEGLRSVTGAALVLTDIPSGKTRHARDDLPPLAELFEAAWGALRPNGAIVMLVSHLDVAAKVLDRPGYRYDLVWEKSIATGFLNPDRPLRSHEHILVFYRERPTYHPQMTQGHEPIHAASRGRHHGGNYGAASGPTGARAGATDRYPRSVLRVPSVGNTAGHRCHPQQKPVDLLAWLVRTYTDPGDLVLDPYAGSGSTGVAAIREGRAFQGWDLARYEGLLESAEHQQVHLF